MVFEGATFGILGAPLAFPRRLAVREVERRGGIVRRGLTRQTTHVLFGRRLLGRTDAEIEALYDAAAASGAELMSEAGFRRRLGALRKEQEAQLSRQSIIEQSRLDPRAFDLLVLFDAFEHSAEPFSFRDLILARKYASLLQSGAGWGAIARSVHLAGKVSSLTAVSLHAEDEDTIYRREGEHLAKLDGQRFFALEDAEDDADELFEFAEAAEHQGEFARAATLYSQYLSMEPADSVAAFNRANVLRKAGEAEEATHSYALAIKLDPKFVEAWFNLGSLWKDRGQADLARQHLRRAIEIDPDYADPIYNLAALAFEQEDLAEARALWSRYVAMDPDSLWGKRAARGIFLIDMTLSAEGKIA